SRRPRAAASRSGDTAARGHAGVRAPGPRRPGRGGAARSPAATSRTARRAGSRPPRAVVADRGSRDASGRPARGRPPRGRRSTAPEPEEGAPGAVPVREDGRDAPGHVLGLVAELDAAGGERRVLRTAVVGLDDPGGAEADLREHPLGDLGSLEGPTGPLQDDRRVAAPGPDGEPAEV